MADPLILPGRVANWGLTLNANFARLNTTALVGSFAVIPLDREPTTGAATSLRYAVNGGDVWDVQQGRVTIGSVAERTALDNATTFVYVSAEMEIVSAPALPTESCIPLARLTTAGGRIVGDVDDLRQALPFERPGHLFGLYPKVIADGGPAATYWPYDLSADPESNLFEVEATSDDREVLLGGPTSRPVGELVVIRRASTSTQAVIVTGLYLAGAPTITSIWMEAPGENVWAYTDGTRWIPLIRGTGDI